MDLVLRQSVFVVIVGMVGPLLVICTTAVVAALVQSVTQVQEQSVSFFVKLITLIVLLYLTAPLVQQHMMQLTAACMQALVAME